MLKHNFKINDRESFSQQNKTISEINEKYLYLT